MARKKRTKKVAGNPDIDKKARKKRQQRAEEEAQATRGRKSARKGSKKVMRRSGVSPTIHCMLAPADTETLLLPTGIMAEVMDYQDPSPLDDSPPWLLGQMEWENRQIPVFSFSALINASDIEKISSKSKILIIKSLADSARVPYLGILLSDLPRMLNVKETDMTQTGDDKKSLGVFSRITIEDQEAIVPDLDRLTHLVTHAAYGALPITQLDD
jgi:chemosensory pili system protein ChpC